MGVSLAGLVARGWLRGMIRELLDLAGLVVGAILAFRMSGPLGELIAGRFDLAPEPARIGAAVGLFFLVGVGTALIAGWLGRYARRPGLNLVDRLGGAVVAVGWGMLLIVAFATVARALPIPPAERVLADSQVVSAVAGPDSPVAELFLETAGDETIQALVTLRETLGDRRVVLDPDGRLEFPPADPEELEDRPDEAQEVFDLLNQARITAGLAPLAWSEPLARVAGQHAWEMYIDGYMSHVSPKTGTVADRVESAGLRFVVVGENLALAVDPQAVHRGLMSSPGHRANILHDGFDRVGVAAVRGPMGLMVVQVFGG